MKMLLIVLLLTGCASERYFTDAEDAQAREVCAKEGCYIVPKPVLERLLERLKGIAI